jgi:hypothetical protein
MYHRTVVDRMAVLLLCLFLPTMTVQAQTPEKEKELVYPISPGWKLEGRVLVGVGLDDHLVGETSGGDEITISGGGGMGIQGLFCYDLSPRLEGSLGLGYMVSSMMPEVENASGTFGRLFIDATLKYRLILTTRAVMKLGAGAGYYLPGDMDLDTREVAGGAHNIYGYDSAPGFHVMGEYERSINERFSWVIGLRGSFVSYDLNSASSDGMEVPLSMVPQEIMDELGSLDGGAVDITFSIIWKK